MSEDIADPSSKVGHEAMMDRVMQLGCIYNDITILMNHYNQIGMPHRTLKLSTARWEVERLMQYEQEGE